MGRVMVILVNLWSFDARQVHPATPAMVDFDVGDNARRASLEFLEHLRLFALDSRKRSEVLELVLEYLKRRSLVVSWSEQNHQQTQSTQLKERVQQQTTHKSIPVSKKSIRRTQHFPSIPNSAIMKISMAILALVASAAAIPQAVTEKIKPEGKAPKGCKASFDSKFEVSIFRVGGNEKRAVPEVSKLPDSVATMLICLRSDNVVAQTSWS